MTIITLNDYHDRRSIKLTCTKGLTIINSIYLRSGPKSGILTYSVN